MLSSWGVAVEAIDVEARPGAGAELARRGIPRVPAVVTEAGAVHGWNPAALAALLGVAWEARAPLDTAELAGRLDRILEAAVGALRQARPEHLDLAGPGRARPLRQLGYHVLRLSLAFRDAMAEGRYPEAWVAEPAPPWLADGPALARYGEAVRQALAAWFARSDAAAGVVETYYGPQPGPELLERTVWHAAQHVRQLQALLAGAGVALEVPLREADLAGLPLPTALW